jgi:AcrR family transcriptional regulator
MATNTPCCDNTAKINEIVEAARKRFGMFGFQKTTMREIAEDLNISKALLYYYFPDKENLYKTVIERVGNDLGRKFEDDIQGIDNPLDMFKIYSQIRLEHYREMINLSQMKFEEFMGIKPLLSDLINNFKRKEIEVISGLIQNGIDKGLFEVADIEATAALFQDLFYGLRHVAVSKFYITPDEFAMLQQKTMAFIEIFIKGISK